MPTSSGVAVVDLFTRHLTYHLVQHRLDVHVVVGGVGTHLFTVGKLFVIRRRRIDTDPCTSIPAIFSAAGSTRSRMPPTKTGSDLQAR